MIELKGEKHTIFHILLGSKGIGKWLHPLKLKKELELEKCLVLDLINLVYIRIQPKYGGSVLIKSPYV